MHEAHAVDNASAPAPIGRFTRQVAIVTGGASGIGAATAQRLAAEGAHVVIADINDEFGAAITHEIGRSGGVASYQHCNVANYDDWCSLSARTFELHGRLDIVHNNAHVHIAKSTHEISETDWDLHFDVCVKQIYNSVRTCIGHLVESRGVIINTASIHALQGFAGHAAYDTAKGGICALTRSLASEYAPIVRVNAVVPGAILTPGWAGVDQAELDRFSKRIPAGRLGGPDEVAAAVCFLASGDATYITGVSLVVDGGWTAARD